MENANIVFVATAGLDYGRAFNLAVMSPPREMAALALRSEIGSHYILSHTKGSFGKDNSSIYTSSTIRTMHHNHSPQSTQNEP